jgi:UDP-3-O-[3-hydroxymyristoyl] N-acetylglucosamine deacetylase/3-hydroxyacyl-[acyl-carrier-protein] dehydratase
MKGQGMLKATRRERTLAQTAEVRGVGFFHGSDVTLRFHPAAAGTGIVFVRSDLPDRPTIPALVDRVASSQRRTTIRQGGASVEMIEHVMAALAGLAIDNCAVEVDAGECPGCDGSSLPFVEALDRAGTAQQDRARQTLVLDRSVVVQDGDAVLAAHPGGAGGTTLAYHLDYGRGAPIAAQSYCFELSPETFRNEVAASRTFLMEFEADALRAAGMGARTTPADLLIFGRDGVIGNTLRFRDECARHKVLDMLGDLALLGFDLHGLVVAHRSGHQTNHALARRLIEHARKATAGCATQCPVFAGGALDVRGIMKLLPHRYPFLLVDRVIELAPGRRAVAVKNVSFNEPFFIGHWPGRPIMPGVLIVEAIAQTAGVLIGASVEDALSRLALIVGIDGVRLRRAVVPGDQLRIEVVGHRIKENAATISGMATVEDAVAAEAKLKFVLLPAGSRPELAGAGEAVPNGFG